MLPISKPHLALLAQPDQKHQRPRLQALIWEMAFREQRRNHAFSLRL